MDLLELRVSDTFACDGVAARARLKIESIEKRIRELKRVRHVLQESEQACVANQETSGCPILDALDDERQPDTQGNPTANEHVKEQEYERTYDRTGLLRRLPERETGPGAPPSRSGFRILDGVESLLS